MIAQHNTVYADQLRRRALLPPKWHSFWLPPLIAVVCSIALLAGVYIPPLRIMLDMSSRPGSVTGLYAPEHNERFSYAYTNGDASLRLPQVGVGRFMVELRMAGPKATVPLTAWLTTTGSQLQLGTVKGVRVYHLLAPTDGRTDLQLRIRSTTARLTGDTRMLGVLLDWLRVRSLGILAPPLPLLLSAPVIILLLWVAIIQLQVSYRWKLAFLILAGAALGASAAIGRDRFAPQPWWLAGAGFLAALITLFRFDGRRFASPVVAVAALLLAWRAALWLISGLGIWYSSAWYPYGTKLTSAGAVISRENFVWRFLAYAWVGWDGGYYRTIALRGYSLSGPGGPSIAFFPLYPLLIRLVLPLTGNDDTIAALLVSHLALFAALILIYDLVTRDFSRPVADRTIILLLLFPASLYFGSGYSESLALALLVAALWALRRQRWWLAGVAGGLLTLTRLPGVLIAPVLAYAYLQDHHWRWRAIRPAFLAVLLPPFALTLFMAYQWWRFGTPFAFLIAQRYWNNTLEPPWVIPRILFTTVTTAADWPMRIVQLATWISFIGLILFALLRLPRPYGLTVFLLLLPPYLSHWHGSFPRYVLIGFPAFVALAILAQRRWLYGMLIAIMLPALAIFTLLFVNGFWVS